MAQDLWPTRRKANTEEIDDLLERIELLAREGEIRELRTLASDLRELADSIGELITKLGSQKLYRTKGGIEEALAHMRGKVERTKVPTGREAVRGMAGWIAEH